jgi:DNA/RNA-binding domain of Phe-tRNA-synthetase-like protein
MLAAPMIELAVAPHPLLAAGAFATSLPKPLGELATPADLLAQLRLDAPSPLATDDIVRAAVRKLLRHGGYKPSGRGKPASEYLLGVAQEEGLGSINLVVDACNAASLHSGLPISVIDLDRAMVPLSIAIPPERTRYVFNASAQEIDVTGLVCLCDAEGPCANAVKDAQRTKTGAATVRTLSIVWGSRDLPGRTARTVAWYRELLARAGATTEDVALAGA